MRVAIDFDDVVFPFRHRYARWRTERGWASFDPEVLEHYLPHLVIGITEERSDLDETAFISSSDALEVTPVPGAPEALATLAAHHELVIVTHRCVTQADGTRAWMARHLGGVVDQVNFGRDTRVGSHQPKAQVCATLEVDVLIDDAAHHLADLAPPTVGIMFGDYSWQRSARWPGHRCADWPAVLRTVEALARR